MLSIIKTKRNDLKTDDANFTIFDRINSTMENNDIIFVNWKRGDHNDDTGTVCRQATYAKTSERVDTLFQLRATRYIENIIDHGKGKIEIVELSREKRNVAINSAFYDRAIKNPDTLVFFGDYMKRRSEGGLKNYGLNLIKNLKISSRHPTYVLIPETNFLLFKDWKELIEKNFPNSPTIMELSDKIEEQTSHQLSINDALKEIESIRKDRNESVLEATAKIRIANIKTQEILSKFTPEKQKEINSRLKGEFKV